MQLTIGKGTKYSDLKTLQNVYKTRASTQWKKVKIKFKNISQPKPHSFETWSLQKKSLIPLNNVSLPKPHHNYVWYDPTFFCNVLYERK
jgi:hypothetical protein